MARFTDRTGERSGRLVVICEAPRSAKNNIRWLCRCDCGNETIVHANGLGITQSCGCLQKEKASAQGTATGKDRSGERVGRLTILTISQRRISGRKAYDCHCDCGNFISIAGSSLRIGGSTSCGCLQSEATAAANIKRMKHGHARDHKPTPEWKSWQSMRQRCSLPSMPNWHLYGGRGITVCPNWTGENGYVNFYNDMGPRPPGTTLDRIENDGNYEPGNCRWATAKEQSNNRRDTPERLAMIRENLKGGRRRWPRKLQI